MEPLDHEENVKHLHDNCLIESRDYARVGLDGPSLDGGLELLRLFLFKRFLSSTIFICSVLSISACASMMANNDSTVGVFLHLIISV